MQTETEDVEWQDAEKREATQDVQRLDPLRFGNRLAGSCFYGLASFERSRARARSQLVDGCLSPLATVGK